MREVRKSSLHNGTLLLDYAPGRSLALLVRHSFHRLNFVSERVLQCAGYDSLLTDGKLQVERWLCARRLAILSDCKNAQGQPVAFLGRSARLGSGNILSLLGIFFRRGNGLITVVDLVVRIIDVIAVAVGRWLATISTPTSDRSPICPCSTFVSELRRNSWPRRGKRHATTQRTRSLAN